MRFLSLRHAIYRELEKGLFRFLAARQRRAHTVIVFERDLRLIGMPRLKLAQHSSLKIGAQCILRSESASNPIGIDQPITFCTLAHGAQIIIGDNVGISGGTICARELVEIGRDTLIGANTYIFDNDFHPLDPIARAKDDYSAVRSAPVRIGTNVFIGTRSIVLKGVTIGDNTVIGAGSVVTHSIPSNCVAGGNPCTVRGQLPSTYAQ